MKTDAKEKVIRAKIVFYGIGFCGKTTNILKIKEQTPTDNAGSYQTSNTEGDQTIQFDLMDRTVELAGGWKAIVRLYTVPGQTKYDASRKLILRGTDAVVFVADSERGKLQENIEARDELLEFLTENKIDINKISYALQLNKRDLKLTETVEDMTQALRLDDEPVYEASAINGTGVMETYHGIVKQTLQKYMPPEAK